MLVKFNKILQKRYNIDPLYSIYTSYVKEIMPTLFNKVVPVTLSLYLGATLTIIMTTIISLLVVSVVAPPLS